MPIIDINVAARLAGLTPARKVLGIFGVTDGPAACRVVARNRRADRTVVWEAQATTFVVWMELASLFLVMTLATAIAGRLIADQGSSPGSALVLLGVFLGALCGSMMIAGLGAARMAGRHRIPDWLEWLYRPSYFTFWIGLAVGVGVAAMVIVG